MLLALDIGNSTIVAALFSEKKKLAEQTVSSTQQRTDDETWSIVTSLLHGANTLPTSLDEVGISSVVPSLTNRFSALSKSRLNIEPLIIGGLLDVGITIHYDNPVSLGADRVCSAVAAYSKFGGPLIVIDFGTATTFGAIGSNGDFLGGAISLGVRSAADALSKRTAQLPQIELQVPSHPICTNTIAAMQAGTMFAAVDAVEGIVKRMRKQLGATTKVVATGGLSELMSRQTTIIDACEPSLVLEGIRLISERIRGLRNAT